MVRRLRAFHRADREAACSQPGSTEPNRGCAGLSALRRRHEQEAEAGARPRCRRSGESRARADVMPTLQPPVKAPEPKKTRRRRRCAGVAEQTDRRAHAAPQPAYGRRRNAETMSKADEGGGRARNDPKPKPCVGWREGTNALSRADDRGASSAQQKPPGRASSRGATRRFGFRACGAEPDAARAARTRAAQAGKNREGRRRPLYGASDRRGLS